MSSRIATYFLYLLFTAAFSSAPKNVFAQKREVPDSVVKQMQKDKDFAYANDSSYWQEDTRRQSPNAIAKFLDVFSRSTFLRVVLYLFLIAALLFAVYHILVVNNFFSFSRRRRKRSAADDTLHDDITSNLDAKLTEAIEAKNYRAAVRFMFLRTLKTLSEKNVITLHAKSTNRDYLQQMYQHSSAGQFRNLTRIYEYVWYGEFQPDEQQFQLISSQFKRFNPTI